jgi:hypothetical protein
MQYTVAVHYTESSAREGGREGGREGEEGVKPKPLF